MVNRTVEFGRMRNDRPLVITRKGKYPSGELRIKVAGSIYAPPHCVYEARLTPWGILVSDKNLK